MLVSMRAGRRTAVVMTAAALALSSPGCNRASAFEPGDLPDLVALPNEAPPGFVYSPRLSGKAEVDDLLADPARQADLERAGLRVARVSLLATPDLLEYLVLGEPDEDPPKHETLLTAVGALFRSIAEADDGLQLFRDDAVDRIQDERPLPADEFGDDAFAFQGTDAQGRQVLSYGWRVGDLVQTVESRGSVDPADVLFIARNMRRRALDAG